MIHLFWDAYAMAFDTYINLRYCIAEAIKEIHYAVDDALDCWGDED